MQKRRLRLRRLRFAAVRRPHDDAVSGDTEALRGAPRDVLEAGEWSTARTSLEAALEREETADPGFEPSMGRKGPRGSFETVRMSGDPACRVKTALGARPGEKGQRHYGRHIVRM
jgi:hypothetical protein